MEKKVRYQIQTKQPRNKPHNIRFTQEMHDRIRKTAEDCGWSFSKVVGESCKCFVELWPLMKEAAEKSERLAGEPVVLLHLRETLQELISDLDEALGEIGESA